MANSISLRVRSATEELQEPDRGHAALGKQDPDPALGWLFPRFEPECGSASTRGRKWRCRGRAASRLRSSRTGLIPRRGLQTAVSFFSTTWKRTRCFSRKPMAGSHRNRHQLACRFGSPDQRTTTTTWCGHQTTSWIYLVHGVVRDTNDQRKKWISGGFDRRGRDAGAADVPERRRDISGHARSATPSSLSLRTRMGLDPGSGRWTSEGGARTSADPDRTRTVHVGVRQPRRWARRRHQGESNGESLERADSRRQTSGRRRRRTVPAGDRTRAGATICASCGSPLLFYLSARGTGDRVWGFQTTSFEITRGAERTLVRIASAVA